MEIDSVGRHLYLFRRLLGREVGQLVGLGVRGSGDVAVWDHILIDVVSYHNAPITLPSCGFRIGFTASSISPFISSQLLQRC